VIRPHAEGAGDADLPVVDLSQIDTSILFSQSPLVNNAYLHAAGAVLLRLAKRLLSVNILPI
jgi:hypothetical protein